MKPEERQKLVSFLPEEYASSSRLDAWIEMAELRVSRGYFGQAYVYAVSLLVAHKAAIESRGAGGDAGQVASKREGDIAITYATGGQGDGSELASTSYGLEFLELRKQYSKRPGITGGLICGACHVHRF